MKRRHQNIRNVVFGLTVVTAVVLSFYSHKVKQIQTNIERQIEIEQAAIEEKNIELIEIQQQADEMDSLEYIKKVATEELGMVEEDAIVFKAKE